MNYTVKGIDKKRFFSYLDTLYEAKSIGYDEYVTLINLVSNFPDLSIVPKTGLLAEMMSDLAKLEALAKQEG
jgi:hypothetical protein